MTRLFINSELLSKLGECSIYYISINIYILYLGLENTTLSNQNFISNKKIYTLIFWRGNKGNKGNRHKKLLQNNMLSIPLCLKNRQFCSPCSPFPFCVDKLPTLFFNGFFEKPKYYHNAYFLCIFTLISGVLNELRQYHHYALLNYISQVVLKPPNMVAYFSKILLFFVCRRKFL